MHEQSHIVHGVDHLQFIECVDLHNVFILACTHRDLIVFLIHGKYRLVPEDLPASRKFIGILDIFRKPASVFLVPIGDPDLLIAVQAADLLFRNDPVFYRKTPVVCSFPVNAKIIRLIMILLDRKSVV